jgi:hypothetical protein
LSLNTPDHDEDELVPGCFIPTREKKKIEEGVENFKQFLGEGRETLGELEEGRPRRRGVGRTASGTM